MTIKSNNSNYRKTLLDEKNFKIIIQRENANV